MSGENANQVPENVRFASSEGIRQKAMTKEDVYNHALVQMGFPVVNVELQPGQMDVLYRRTLDEYNKWLPVYKLDIITSVSSQINEYDLRALQKPYGRGITDVQIVSKQQFFAPISGVFALGIPHPISHLSPDQYDLALRYIGTAKKVYSSALDWEWEEPILWLFAPTGFGGPFSCAYQYMQDCYDANDIPAEDWGWFKDDFFNRVKMAVGEARGKFGSIPGPAGQTLRGTDMVKEAQDALKKLEEDIRSKSLSRVPPLFLNAKG